MSGSPQPTRSGRPPVSSREALIEAGLELIDEQGIGALSMRAISARLGISAMTPYSYFASKAELHAAIAQHALAALTHDAALEQPWDRELEAAMQGLRASLQRHPGILALLLDRSELGVGPFRRELIAMLEDSGFTSAGAADALRMLTAYVIGYALIEGDNHHPRSFDRGLRMQLDCLRGEVHD